MRKSLYITIATTLLIGLTTAVVGGPEAGEGELTITSTSSSASTAIVSNGTDWRSEVKMTGGSSTDTENNVSGIAYSGNEEVTEFSFEGVITAPTPCYYIDQETTKEGENTYVLNIQTVKDNQTQFCTQVVTGLQYEASFEDKGDYQLEVQHDGETVKTIETPGYNGGDQGILSRIANWLRNLF